MKVLLKKTLQFIIATLVLGFSAQVFAEQSPDDLAAIFLKPESWGLSASAFRQAYSHLEFRLPDENTAVSIEVERLKFLTLPVYEVRVHFEGSSVRRVEISLYNKGDAGERGQTEFENRVEKTKAAILAFVENPGIPVSPSSPRPNYFISRHQWPKFEPAIQLEWAYIRPHRSGGHSVDFNAEYISVLLVPNAASSRMASASAVSTAQRLQHTSSIKDNVRRGEDGDVWVDGIPMVDQGQKGYCAAATSERILRYYGLDVDQHQIAQIANTAAEGGTSIQGMVDAVSNVAREFQLDRRDIVSAGTGSNFAKSSYVRQLNQYNVEAKRRGAPTIDWKQYLSNNSVDLNKLWADMKPDILLVSQVNQKMAFERFFQEIKNYTVQGVPLMWSCLVGMYPENPPLGQSGAFGHVRLIIGYNERTREVLYSDTWGASHTLKRLPVDHAWAMTKALFVLKPRNVR